VASGRRAATSEGENRGPWFAVFVGDGLAHPAPCLHNAGILRDRTGSGTLAGRIPALPGITMEGCTPGFLRKSAQTAEKTRDSCDPEKERVHKSLKTRRDECAKLVIRANEQREEENRGGVLNGRGLAVGREWRGIVMRAVVQGRGHKDSAVVAGSGGGVGALASHGDSISQ